MDTWIVEYTPGPPAIGELTKKEVEARSSTEAHTIIKNQHRWVMIHKIHKKEPEKLPPEKAYLQEKLTKAIKERDHGSVAVPER